MYVNEIYGLMDDIFDKIYEEYLIDNTKKGIIDFKAICSEKIITKKIKDINKLLNYLFDMIDMDKINNLVKMEHNVNLIVDLLRMFIYYYIFIFIGLFYEYKVIDFNNNLIEMCREESNYNEVPGNMFSAETTAKIIKSMVLVKQINSYFENKTNIVPDVVVNFISLYGNIDELELFIKQNKKNIKMQYHVLTKLIISVVIFTETDKKHIFDEIESNELSIGEFMYIDVIMPKRDYIDITDIENILVEEDIEAGYANIIYDMINSDEYDEIEKIKSYAFQYDNKIIKLFEYHFCVPIVDDFLLYHKDYYKYEKKSIGNEQYVKKKDDIKIKYIVDKINTVKDYYNNKELAKTYFYSPIADKRAVLINAEEMYTIRSSFDNMIKYDNTYADYIQDLEEYDEYPYISFKDYDQTYFVLSTNNTIDAFRSINFKNDYPINFKNIQTRVISKNMYVNVIGIAITKNVKDYIKQSISDYTIQNDNILDNIKKMIRKKIMSFFNVEKQNKNKVFLFDKNMEKLFITTGVEDNNEKVKIFLSSLFDYSISILYDTIKNYIITQPKNIVNNSIIFQKFCIKYDELLNKDYSKLYNEMQYFLMYEHVEEATTLEDKNELMIYGFDKNAIKLKKINKEIIKLKNEIYLDLSYKQKKNIIVESNMKISSNAICQHNISWSNINKSNNNELYAFLRKYGYKNKYKMYICKSCGYVLDLKKYEFEQSFDSKFQTHEFVELTYSGALEDISEYSKYDICIKSIKKFIERISGIFGIKELLKGGYNSYIRIKVLLKNLIDLMIYQEKEYKETNYLTHRKTNNLKLNIPLSPDYNDFFVFELSNSIFAQSSKDKLDYMKIQKFNNVLCYILVMICLDMTETTILNLKGDDKMCSFTNFNASKKKIFNNIKIYNNLSFDVEPILNYPILCYVLYIFSCFLLRYNVWGNKITDKASFPKYQITIIHTSVEILNHIITVDYNKYIERKIYLYDILIKKYFIKLQLFKNKELYSSLVRKYTEIVDDKHALVVINGEKDIDLITLGEDTYEQNLQYYAITHRRALQFVTLDMDFKKPDNIQLSNKTVCNSGSGHNYVKKGKDIICAICNENANENEIIEHSFEDVLVDKYLVKMSKKYCLDGKMHKMVKDKCLLCNYDVNNTKEWKKDELLKMYNNVEELKNSNDMVVNDMMLKITMKNEEEHARIRRVIEKCIYKFQKYNNDITHVVDILIDNIQKIMGKELYIDNEQYNLFDDIYILTHDLDGKLMDMPEIILNNNKLIKTINKHPIYKTNTLSVLLVRNKTKYEAIFDKNTLMLLGYRKQGKDFIDSIVTTCKLKINYSLKNMLLYFGFSRIEHDKKDYDMDGDTDMDYFVNSMISYRFYNIRQLGYLINKYISRYSNKYIPVLKETVDLYKESQIKNYKLYNNDILDLIYSKIDIPTITLDEYKNDTLHSFMKYYIDLYNYLPFNAIDENINNNSTIPEEFILKHDYASNIILNYIYDEIIRLMKYNMGDLSTLKNTITFIISIITKKFNNINLTKHLNDNESYTYKKLLLKTEFFREYTQILTKQVETDNLLSEKNMEDGEYIGNEDANEILNINNDDEDEYGGLDVEKEDIVSDDEDYINEDE
jgi:hypothetical protein